MASIFYILYLVVEARFKQSCSNSFHQLWRVSQLLKKLHTKSILNVNSLSKSIQNLREASFLFDLFDLFYSDIVINSCRFEHVKSSDCVLLYTLLYRDVSTIYYMVHLDWSMIARNIWK